jgi:hypothetical protein
MVIIKSAPILRTPEQAELNAKQLNADEEDGWTYKVNHHNSGLSSIEVYDEEDNFLGIL